MAISYLMIGSNDLARSRAFYDAVLTGLGAKVETDIPDMAFCYRLRDGSHVWVSKPYDGAPATSSNGGMIGYDAGSREAVDAAHAAAQLNGGSNEGDPGPRPMYGPHFYGAYARDPDGNKMSFVFLSKDAE